MSKVPPYQTDEEIIEGIRNFEGEAERIVYVKHKDNCLSFMKTMYDDMETIKDIYHDAVMVLILKLRSDNNFKLTCKIQTYLNSICKHQVWIRYGKKGPDSLYDVDQFDENIKDWYEEDNSLNNERIKKIEQILNDWIQSDSRCHKIITAFYYRNMTMEEIASIMNLTNSDNAKNQKYRCINKLKELLR